MFRGIRIAASALLACAAIWAQSTAQIQGVVKDSSGSIIPGAEVKATQTDTGTVRTTNSGADGLYVLANLPLGPYRLEVSGQGFTTYVQTGIVLQVASNPTIDVTLKVGAVSEQVQVEANAALVETERTGVGTVVETKQIVDLPLNGRNAIDLIPLSGAAITTSPGVANIPGSESISVAGGQTYGVEYLLDGAEFGDQFDGTSLPFPFPDALQEFKVESSALTAQNGEHSGAAVNAVTKSGTNSFHGDAFEFLRNGAVNARNFFATTPDTLKRNQFGGTLGGPIKKDKLFFFFGYEGTRTRQAPTGSIAYVPTAEMLDGNFTDFASPSCNGGKTLNLPAPFVNDQISPSLFSASALAVEAKLPTATNPCGRVNYGVASDPNAWQAVGRVDYQINAKHSLFGRYINTAYYLPAAVSLPGASILSSSAGGQNALATSATLGETWLINPSTVNSLRLAFNRISNHGFNGNTLSGCDVGVQMFCYVPHISTFSVTGGFTIGGALASPTYAVRNTIQLSDDISLVKGNHQIGFGFSEEQYKGGSGGATYSQSSFSFSGVATGSGLADFLLGDVGTFTQGNQRGAFNRKYIPGLYVRDTWKVTPRLTVNLGLRWEPSLPEAQLNGAVYDFNLAAYEQGIYTSQYTNAPPGLTYPGDPGFNDKSGMNDHWKLFAPRVGLAWDPIGDGKTVIRAAYGIAYDFPNAQFFNNTNSAPPWGNLITIPGPISFSNPWATYPGGNIFPYAVNKNTQFAKFGNFVSLSPNIKTTTVNQWNFGVQRQVGNNMMVSATYVGSETAHLWGTFQLNPGTIVPSSYALGTCPAGVTANCNSTSNLNQRRVLYLQNPQEGQYIGYMDQVADGGTASYNGLILAFQRRLTKGLSIDVNYTWSHCIGDQADGSSLPGGGAGYTIPSDRRFDRGDCSSASATAGLESSDRRHIFNLSVVGQAPQFQNAALKHIVTGWQLSGIYRVVSGPSLTVTSPTDRALNGQTNERLNQILPDPLCANPGPSCWINPAAFALPALGTIGNMGSNNVPGPGFFQFDMALLRDFRIHESMTWEIRAEAFNVTNSFRAGVLSNDIPTGSSGVVTSYSNTFGQILSALDPRILQFAMKFVF